MALTPCLYDPFSDFAGAPANREGGQMTTMELGGQYSQPPQQLQTDPGEGEDIHMVPQPETRPINPEQLMAEVKGVLAWLLIVEAKRPEVHAKQATASHDGYEPKLNNEQLQALTVLHRTLLHERHDALASQHPGANPSLRRPAPNYSVRPRTRYGKRGANPGRCWGKGHNRKINRGRRWHCGR